MGRTGRSKAAELAIFESEAGGDISTPKACLILFVSRPDNNNVTSRVQHTACTFQAPDVFDCRSGRFGTQSRTWRVCILTNATAPRM